MSGHVGLREDARIGALLAVQIARLFAPVQRLELSHCVGGNRLLALNESRLNRGGG
jgi:hypothetical protein